MKITPKTTAGDRSQALFLKRKAPTRPTIDGGHDNEGSAIVTGPMKTDSATLSAEAANFDRIAGELKAIISGVESTGTELAGGWQGQAGTAAQEALVRFQEAARRQESQLMDISSNVSQAGIQYSSADEEQAGSLSSQMDL